MVITIGHVPKAAPTPLLAVKPQDVVLQCHTTVPEGPRTQQRDDSNIASELVGHDNRKACADTIWQLFKDAPVP